MLYFTPSDAPAYIMETIIVENILLIENRMTVIGCSSSSISGVAKRGDCPSACCLSNDDFRRCCWWVRLEEVADWTSLSALLLLLVLRCDGGVCCCCCD